MRMWMVPPIVMCQQHLLGEHVEMHMLIGAMKKGTSMAGYCQNGLMEPAFLAGRHEALADEIDRRGMNHKSPVNGVEVSFLISKMPEWQQAATVDRKASADELRRRRPKCAERMKAYEEGYLT